VIPGEHNVPGVISIGFTTPVPSYCHQCGEPYPWTKREDMFAEGFRMILEHHGQDAEIRRQGSVVTTAKGLVAEKDGRLSFLPNTDIRSGDEVYFPLSEKLFAIDRVEKSVAGNELHCLRAYYTQAPQAGQPVGHRSVVVHGQYIEGGSFHNSPMQVNSPNAAQTVTIGREQKDAVREAVRAVLEILDHLDLTGEDKDEVRADAEAVESQLKSPRTKWTQVKEFMKGIGDKVKAGITASVAAGVVAKGEAVVKAITDYVQSGGQ
jgi:hypothetical protein